jgi:Tol biopolymer transport system component
MIYSARFLPGADSAVYTTYSEADGVRTMRLKVQGNNPRPVLVDTETLVSVSPSGDLVVRTNSPHQSGTQLSQVSLSGKKIDFDAKNARAADWAANGRQLALLRRVGVESIVEFPAGRIAYRCSGFISDLRVSPDGNWAAFIEHPMRDDDRGHIRVVDRNGNTRELTADWSSAVGLAWSHSGREIWFTASKTGVVKNLYAVSTSGVLRRLSNTPASLRLFDIAADGRVLLSVDDIRGAMLAQFPGAHEAADVSQFDEPYVQAMSSDGQRILFTESGDAGGQHYKTLLLDNTNHSSRIIGSGRAMGMSPDGRLVLLLDPQDNQTLAIVPLQGGSCKRISGGGLRYQWARFLSQDVLVAGASFPTGRLMLYRQSLDGSSPVALSALPYLDYPAIAPDHCRAVGRSATDLMLVNFCQNTAEPLHVPAGAIPAAWSADGTSVVLALTSEMPPAIAKLDLGSNSLTKWNPLHIPQNSSSAALNSIVAAPEAGAFAYSIEEQLSRLYIVDGWS